MSVLRHRPSGQIAIGFIVLMGLVLVFTGMTISLGQMAQVRAAVSNAADAGALAGASWMASGENEAVGIALKMHDSKALVQAMFLVPFCPGSGLLARALVDQLHFNNMFRFRPWADAVMTGAWNIGRREMVTASTNNMLIRFNCTVGGLVGWGGSAEDIIRDMQREAERSSSFAGMAFGWTNCQPAGDPRLLLHSMQMRVDGYPLTRPTLDMMAVKVPYLEYENDETGLNWPCNFAADGILTMPVGSTVPDITSGVGAVDLLGRKAWDIDTHTLYPAVTDAVIADCGGVCGVTLHDDKEAWMPLGIINGDGNVTVSVEHTVERATGDWLEGVPLWDPTARPAGASATAHFKAASIAFGLPDAQAELTAAQ